MKRCLLMFVSLIVALAVAAITDTRSERDFDARPLVGEPIADQVFADHDRRDTIHGGITEEVFWSDP